MMKETPSWTTKDNKVHTDYRTALKHELYLWISEVTDNTVAAKKIIEALNADSIGPFVDVLEKLEEELCDPTEFKVIKVDETFTAPSFMTVNIAINK